MQNTTPDLPRVLIVDDERQILELCESALAPHAKVTSVTRGADAFQAASTLRPDVILLDIAMPGVDGWHVCRELRADARTASIPVIVLTGHDDDHTTATAIRHGVRAVLTKPCSVDRLIAALLAAAETSQRQRDEDALEQYYELFNERRSESLAADDGMAQWMAAFPDSTVSVLRIDPQDGGYGVELLAEGTHRSDFEIKPFGWFKASGRKITLRLRHHVVMQEGKVRRSVVSFDPQDLGRQLVERAS